MSSPFVAEIRAFPFNFPPKGWAFCDGQLLPISQNTAVFSLLGTFYGGNGTSTFALPNLQGNIPIHQGQGPGLSLYDIGQTGGSQTVTLLASEMPIHSHTLFGDYTNDADSLSPAGGGICQDPSMFSSATTPIVAMSPSALSPAGSSFPHNNMMPYLTLNFCIALQGVFPARP